MSLTNYTTSSAVPAVCGMRIILRDISVSRYALLERAGVRDS